MRDNTPERAWVAHLSEPSKHIFLAVLGHELTIAARNSYRAGTEELDKPRQLRQINEVQHRVLACLSQSLSGHCDSSFQEAIADYVLNQEDLELAQLLGYAWSRAKESVGVGPRSET